jgi:hypothetical protein
MSSRLLMLVGLFSVISGVALACLEHPKKLFLSQTTFENDAQLSYGVNGQVRLSVITTDGTYYGFTQDRNSTTPRLCMSMWHGSSSTEEYCGDDLVALAAQNKIKFTIADKDGKSVGFISVTPNSIQFLSWKGGPTKTLPYIQIDINDMRLNWSIKGMDNENSKPVGQGKIVSNGIATRAPERKDGEFDLRGKSFETGGEGCAAGVLVSDFTPASGPPAAKPAAEMHK